MWIVTDGIITIGTINEAHGKCPVLSKQINSNTGKVSTITLAFNNDDWGNISRSLTKSAMRITQSATQFKNIEKAAKEFSKSSIHFMDSMSTNNAPQDVENDNDDWENLPLNIELEDGGNSD